MIVQCVMLNGLELRCQRRFERDGTYEMFQEMKFGFHARALVERYETSNKTICLESKGENLNP